jgi:hypothetical protein
MHSTVIAPSRTRMEHMTQKRTTTTAGSDARSWCDGDVLPRQSEKSVSRPEPDGDSRFDDSYRQRRAIDTSKVDPSSGAEAGVVSGGTSVGGKRERRSVDHVARRRPRTPRRTSCRAWPSSRSWSAPGSLPLGRPRPGARAARAPGASRESCAMRRRGVLRVACEKSSRPSAVYRVIDSASRGPRRIRAVGFG